MHTCLSLPGAPLLGELAVTGPKLDEGAMWRCPRPPRPGASRIGRPDQIGWRDQIRGGVPGMVLGPGRSRHVAAPAAWISDEVTVPALPPETRSMTGPCAGTGALIVPPVAVAAPFPSASADGAGDNASSGIVTTSRAPAGQGRTMRAPRPAADPKTRWHVRCMSLPSREASFTGSGKAARILMPRPATRALTALPQRNRAATSLPPVSCRPAGFGPAAGPGDSARCTLALTTSSVPEKTGGAEPGSPAHCER